MVVTSVPAGWGSAPDRDVMLGKGAVVGSNAGWASVLTGDVPSTNDKGGKDEVVVTDTMLADVTAVIETDETGAEDVRTGWSLGVADGVGNYNDSIHHNFMCVSGGVVLIPGLCCLSFYLLAIHN